MKNLIYRLLVSIACGSLCLSLSVFSQERYDQPLTNAAVIKLIRAGFKEKTVVSIIRSRPNQFKLDPDHLIELKRNGVGENIILAMLSQDYSVVSDPDDWSDDSFAKQRNGNSGDPGGLDSSGSRADIFGSGGNSKSEVHGRGMNGSNQRDTMTTGSATVRIIRPPSESADAPLKLEKTPTLNNDAIVRLVEAGFSEGTIIKRIEDSPVEFDLSAAKLEDLRKRRVTETVIAAMNAAMEDPVSKQSAQGKGREN